ncbi:MAG TPA: NUDIX hydrolase [Chloroflexota bacterium]|nr:NUDIX hydrolase [Chloroflexota bacterium]
MSPIEPVQILSEETIYQGSLIDLKRERVRLPNGKETTREVVVHPQVVVMIPVLDDGRLLLIRQYRDAIRKETLEVPAGGIDDGETPEQAVRREMKEETGYSVGSLQAMTSFYSSPGFTTELMHLFLCQGLQPGTPTEPDDQIEPALLSLDEVMSRVWDGTIVDAKTILSLALYRLQDGRG